jgi:iron(III) transport system substrate-binding protein
MPASIGKILAVAVLVAASSSAGAQEKVLNLYSSRHYQTDEALYTEFTRQTGIRINRIEAPEDALIERLRSEGAASPADVLVTVDAGRLWRAEQLGLLQPVQSKVLESKVPAHLRHPEGLWFGFSTRARVIVYNKASVKPTEIRSYEDLADPKWKGKVCMRSSSNIYNLSLGAALISHAGEQKTEEWAKGVVGNFARAPKGGDTDQIKAVAAGECALTISNTYYYARLAKSTKPDERDAAAKTGVVWPNQDGRGTHVNISGAGVLKNAPHREEAVKFLEYLAGNDAQRYFADGNNEFPVVSTATIDNPALKALGNFKPDTLNVSALGRHQPEAQKVYDRAGWR